MAGAAEDRLRTQLADLRGLALAALPRMLDEGSALFSHKTLVRGDFHKSVGTRVMRQSTMVMLAHGSVVSFTVIGGTDDQVEDLVDSLSFTPVAKK